MPKIKNLLIIFLLIVTTSCSRTMNSEHFVKTDQNQQIAVFKIKFTYDGSHKNIDSSSCHITFSDESDNLLKYRIKNDYVFLSLKPEDKIKLAHMECMSYRVFYNKIRFRKVNQKIFSAIKSDKIIYGGDVEINWVPEVFKVFDLFNFGHMGINDEGTFTMRLEDNYSDYENFMKLTYEKDSSQSINGVDKDLMGKVFE